MLLTLRSIVDPVPLAALAAREYGLEVTGCVLLRSLVNDVNRVDTPAVLLVGGNSAGEWVQWYGTAIPVAEVAYEAWLAVERASGGRRDDGFSRLG